MKKKSIVLYLVLFVLLGACSKDDDGNGNGQGGINKSQNLLAVGDSASDILGNDTFTDLLVEIAYVEGFRPTTQTMNTFETFLRDRTFKENIEIRYLSLPSPNQESLTIQEVANLEDQNRTAFNDEGVLAIYIYFADAPDETDDDATGLLTLGSVYRNTSMVIYEQTVRELAAQSVLVTVTDVESATLNHEFGHLFGLVDLGTPMINDHEDESEDENGNLVGNNHCDIEGCLMRAELQFGGGIMSMLESMASRGLAIPSLDAECILDLQGNGGR